MFQRFIILTTAMLFALGCSLTTEVARTATPLPTQTPMATPLPQPSATATSAPVVTPTTSAPATPIPVANRPCTTRTDWPIYTVLAGDTLSDIAARSGSTVNELSTGNCLTNANNIFTGQQIRVPRIPATATPKPTNTPTPVPTSMDNTPRILSFRVATETNPSHLEWYTWNAGWAELSVSGPRGAYIGYGNLPANSTFVLPDLGMEFAPDATFTLRLKDMAGQDVIGPNGQLVTAQLVVRIGDAPLGCPALNSSGTGEIQVSPVIGMEGRCSYVNMQQTIWVTWDGITGIDWAEFYFLPTAGSACGTPGNPNVIGTDQNPADGTMITWYVGSGPCAGVLYAFGYGGNTMIESRQHALVVYNK